jgi:biotin transport system substrate-specific component
VKDIRVNPGPKKWKLFDLTITAMFTVFAVIGGKIVIPVFVVPFTLQVAVCLLTGMVLGFRRAIIAQGLYFFMGMIGLPVFSAGGGPGYIFQPSFGYLPGMVLAAGLVGFLADRADPDRSSLRVLTALLIHFSGLVIIYCCGVGYLYILKTLLLNEQMTLVRALEVGLLPFLITDGIFATILAFLAPGLRQWSRPYFVREGRSFKKTYSR